VAANVQIDLQQYVESMEAGQITKMKTAKSGIVLPQLHPLSILFVLWKHKVLILAATVVITAVAGAIIFHLPDVYRADAIVLVDSQKIPEKFVSSTVQVSLQDSLNSISQQVLSTSQLQTIITDLKLYTAERKTDTMEEILDRMKNRDLSITLERGLSGSRSGAFKISYEGENGAVVAAVVNRVAGLFIRENFKNREARAEGTSEFIDQQLQQAKKSLDEQEASLSTFKMQWNGELPEQQAALLNALSRLQTEFQAQEEALNRANQNRLLLANTLQIAESSVASTTRELGQASAPRQIFSNQPDTQGSGARPLQPVHKRSDDIRVQLEAARSRYFDDHPEVKRLQTELNRVVAREAAEPAPSHTGTVETAGVQTTTPRVETVAPDPAVIARLSADLSRDRERVATTKTQITLLDREIIERTAEERRIQKALAVDEGRVEKLPLREQQMARLMRDYDTSKANYRSLLDKKMSARMANDMERGEQSERFTIADPAREPSRPFKPKRWILSGVSALAALGFCMLIALVFEMKKGIFLGEWELPSDLPVMGRIGVLLPPAATHSNAGLRNAVVAGVSVTVFSMVAKIARTWFEKGA
jgi:succinoglycan biosynthesis transport protein ExoP